MSINETIAAIVAFANHMPRLLDELERVEELEERLSNQAKTIDDLFDENDRLQGAGDQ